LAIAVREFIVPIYVYRCENCGLEKELLQKMSDPPLTHCESCDKDTMVKQVTAAGFELKGTGWYVTDFRDGGKPSSGGSAES
jgi:putative FmdB family regulatory protein